MLTATEKNRQNTAEDSDFTMLIAEEYCLQCLKLRYVIRSTVYTNWKQFY